MPITQGQKDAAEERQRNAAHDTNSKARLIAGPGTGKSYAIKERVNWLLGRRIPAETIFVVSFTNAATRELKAEIQKYCLEKGQPEVDRVNVTTLHSLALRLLRQAGVLETYYPADPLVLDEWEQKNIFDSEFAVDSGLKRPRCEIIRRANEAFWSTGV
jgi:superfamily I DNA/RNA helicase